MNPLGVHGSLVGVHGTRIRPYCNDKSDQYSFSDLGGSWGAQNNF